MTNQSYKFWLYKWELPKSITENIFKLIQKSERVAEAVFGGVGPWFWWGGFSLILEKKPGVYFSRLSIIFPNVIIMFRKNKNLFEILHWVWHVDFKKLPFSYRALHWNSNTFILIILVPGSYIVFMQEEITVLKYFSSQCQMPQKRLLCRFIKPLRDSTKKKNFKRFGTNYSQVYIHKLVQIRLNTLHYFVTLIL